MSRRSFEERLFAGPKDTLDFLENILEASTEYSIIGKDLDGTILLWNQGARRLYGYEPEEVIGKMNASALHIPDDVLAGKPRQVMDEALRDGKWEGVIARRRKDGSTFSARVVVTPRRESSGKPIGFLLISKDISEELRLTEQIESTQFYTRSLVESNIDALIVTDPVGVISDVNEQMCQMTGYSREQLIGSPFKNYFTDPAAAENGIRLTLVEGKVTNYELTARAKDSRETVVSYNATTFNDRDGKLQGVFAAARDVTEHKHLEQQLRDSQAYNRGLIEASVDGLITVAPEGLITDVNDRMCQMTGYSREELIGSPFAPYFTEPEKATTGVEETLKKSVVTDYGLTLIARDGRKVRVSFNASVFRDPAGQVRGIFASARDITEQSRLQAQLAEERAYNRGLIEASLDGLVTVDPMLNVTDVNDTMCRMTGYARSELIGAAFPQFFADPTRAAEGVRLTLDRGAVENYQLTLRTKDGAERLVSFNAAIFTDEAGSRKGIFASARDITEQARLQNQLTDEQAYNRGLIEASVDGLVTVNEAGVITDVNETMCRMSGRPRTQLVGSPFATYFLEADRAGEGVRLTFKQGAVTNYVLTLQAADGRKVPVSFNAAVFKDTAGAVRGIFASARDITAQKQLEQQLRDSQLYTRSLIESNIDALMTTDPVGIITDVNEQMCKMTGFSREQLIGSPFKSYFTDSGRAENGIRLTLREGKVTNYELTARAKDGRETVVSYNAAIFNDPEGKLQGVFAAARDVTDNKRLEQKLRESEAYNRGLIEASVDGLVTVAPDGFITDVNDRMCTMTGYFRQDLVGSAFAQYFVEPERASAGLQETLQKGVVTDYGLTLIARSRRQLQVSFNASVFKNAEGAIRGIFASARDITDRIRLEEQLREQQSYLRGLIEASVDGLVTVDPEGFITDVNDQMCTMTGYERSELIGSPFKQYFTSQAEAERGVKRTFADSVVTNYELVLQSKDGRKATVSFNASVFKNSEGRLQGIFASARDITTQARLQIQLAEQEAYNRSLIEASADALFAIAPEGLITDVNEEATRLTGYSRRHLVNSRFADYFTDPTLAQAGVQKTFAEGRVLEYELILVTRHGRRVVVSFNAGVFRDTSGVARGILAGARAITAQKQLEQQLRDSQLYTRSLIESNIDALMTTDPLGVITDVNEQMCKMTGYSREQLVGSPFKQYFTEPAAAENGIRLTLREGKVTNYELTARSHEGRETVVSYNATTFKDREGKLQGVFAAARDVTELKRVGRELAEARIYQAQRLESLGSLAGGIAHDFNNLLSVITNYTGFVAEGIGKDSPLRPDVEQIQRAAERAASLTHQLLTFGRREVVKPQVLELNTVVSEMEKMLRRTIGEQIELRAVFGPDLWRVKVDPSQVEQVLMNLVVNSRDAMPSGGLLKIETSNAVLDEGYTRNFSDVNPGRYVCLSVSDTGVGMDVETTRRAFEPFFTTKPKGKGTGLGLATVYGIGKQAGGHVAIYSEPNKGTVVRMYLPASDEVVLKPRRAVAEGSLDGQQQTILLVEDEDAVRELSRRILTRHGYRVIDASGGGQALELYEKHTESIDLLLTDVVMPQMTGKALAERIRQQRPGIRVLYMSGYPEDVVAYQGTLAEGVDLLQKPFNEESLLRAVQRLLTGSAAGQSSTDETQPGMQAA